MTALMERTGKVNNTYNNRIEKQIVKRAEIWLADLRGTTGKEQTGVRPFLITQNDKGNYYSPVTTGVPITSATTKSKFVPTHVKLDKRKCGLEHDSIALVEQLKSIDQDRLICKISDVDEETMRKIELAIMTNNGFEYLIGKR